MGSGGYVLEIAALQQRWVQLLAQTAAAANVHQMSRSNAADQSIDRSIVGNTVNVAYGQINRSCG